MTEQITVYRLESGPLCCDAILYCAEVKRLTSQGAALLYPLLFLIYQSTEQRPCQQSQESPPPPSSQLTEWLNLKLHRDKTLNETDS